MNALLLAATLWIQSPAITYSTAGTPLSEAFKSLNAQVEPDWRVDGALAHLVVVADFKDVPQAELKARIADVFQAEWRDDGAVHTLWRSPAKVKELQAADLAQREAAFAKMIQRHREKVAKARTFDAAFKREVLAVLREVSTDEEGSNEGAQKRMDQMYDSFPEQVAFSRLLASLNPKMLALLNPDYPAVFSFTPTRMQHRLDPGLQSTTFAELRTFQEFVGDVMKELKDLPMFRGEEGADQYFKLLAQPVAKVLLKVSPLYSEDWGGAASLALFDAEGREIYSVNNWRGYGEFGSAEEAPLPKDFQVEPTKLKGSKFFQDWVKWYQDENSGDEFPKEMLEVIRQPETIDPISWEMGAFFVESAQIKKAPLLAHLSDSILIVRSEEEEEEAHIATQEPTADEDLSWTDLDLYNEVQRTKHELRLKDGWITASPRSALKAQLDHLDRKIMGQILRAKDELRNRSINEKARFIASLERNYYSYPSISYLQQFTDFFLGANFDDSAMRLWHALGDGTVARMINGQSVAIAPGQNPLHNLVFRLLFAEELMLSNPQGLKKAEQTVENDFMMGMDSLATEPTEISPNGNLAGTSITATMNTSVVLRVTRRSADGDTYNSWMTPASVGSALANEEYRAANKSSSSENSGTEYRIDTLQLGTRRSYLFRIGFGPTAEGSLRIVDDQLSPSPATKLNGLPKSIYDEIMKVKQQRLESYKKLQDPPQASSK
jgi:hypothetical protein